jgi:hypothetical protein
MITSTFHGLILVPVFFALIKERALRHVKSENGAQVVYQQIGFRLRSEIRLRVISLR